MGDFSDSSMIAFLPTNAEWCKQDLPHLTLVYTGSVEEGGSDLFQELAFDSAVVATLMPRFTLLSLGVDQFGEADERVDVLRLVSTSALDAVRRIVARHSKSEYKDYKPHVTLGPVGSSLMTDLPSYVSFDRLVLAWGDQKLLFHLAG